MCPHSVVGRTLESVSSTTWRTALRYIARMHRGWKPPARSKEFLEWLQHRLKMSFLRIFQCLTVTHRHLHRRPVRLLQGLRLNRAQAVRAKVHCQHHHFHGLIRVHYFSHVPCRHQFHFALHCLQAVRVAVRCCQVH